jgi:hypothetical protein
MFLASERAGTKISSVLVLKYLSMFLAQEREAKERRRALREVLGGLKVLVYAALCKARLRSLAVRIRCLKLLVYAALRY